MPYSNVPDADQGKMDDCVKKVMDQGHDKPGAIAICYASIVGKARTPDAPAHSILKELQDGIAALFAKYGARHSKADQDAIQAVHDHAVDLGAMCVKARAYGSALTVYKASDGWRWLGVVSNGYKDLDGENITSAAHREFVAYLDANPQAAPLFESWHTAGTERKARADWWDYTDNGFLWMGGPLTDDEAAQMQKSSEPLGMSHGFRGVKQGSDIVFYRTFEASELPITAAANPWTALDVLQEGDLKMFTPDKRKFLVDRFGEERTAQLEADEAAQAKALKESGVLFKGTMDQTAVAARAAEAKADPVAPPAPEAPGEGEGRTLDDVMAMLATLQAQVAALVEAFGPMQGEMEAGKAAREVLTTQVVALTAQAKALQESDDAKIARAMNPRMAPAATSVTAQAVPASGAPDGAQSAIAAVKEMTDSRYSWLQTVKPF